MTPDGTGRASSVRRRLGRLRRLTAPVVVALLAAGCLVDASWTLQDVEQVEPPRTSTVVLTAVDCPAAGACVGIGSLSRGAWPAEPGVLLRQQGDTWERVALPANMATTLRSVSCRAVDDCLAVGQPLDVHLGPDGVELLLAPDELLLDKGNETVECTVDGCLRLLGTGSWWWDGDGWGPRLPLPEGFQPSERRVSCPSAQQCVAIASQKWFRGLVEGPDSGPVTATVWDGAAWSPISVIHDYSRGAALDCPAPDSCFATLGVRSSPQWPPVLPSGSNAVVVRWDGETWTDVAISYPGAPPTEPAMLSCSGPSGCVFQTVQGHLFGGPDYLGRWDGQSWTVVASPGLRNLDAMSCATQTDCVAVGVRGVQRLVGDTWAGMTSPSRSVPTVALDSVACATDELCIAANDFRATSYDLTLQVYDGASWTAVPSWDTDAAVDCAPEVACFAASAGRFGRWDGAWADLAPPPVAPGWYLRDLDCPSAAWCVAVVWDGTDTETFSWAPDTGWAALAPPPGLAGLSTVMACDAPGSCLLVASDTYSSPPPVAFRLSGGSWSPVALEGDVGSMEVTDLDCPEADACVAAGLDTSSRSWALAVQGPAGWDVTVTDRFPGTARVDCWAPGNCVTVSGYDAAPVLLRDGRLTDVEHLPQAGGLLDVSCPEARVCEVVGRLVEGDTLATAARLVIESSEPEPPES